MFRELALFAGVGGGILGGKLLGWRTVCAVEKEPYCREVLLRRQRDGLLPLFPIWDDIKTFDGRPWNGIVDIVSAGFPCQPFSFAGERRGEADERNLWPDTLRVLCEVRPRYALLENVPGLLATRYFGRILGDLAEGGFDVRWDCVPASAVGAPHRRDRLWIVVTDPEGLRREEIERDESDGVLPAFLADAERFWRRESPISINPSQGAFHSKERQEGSPFFGPGGQDVADSEVDRRDPRGARDAEEDAGRRKLDRSGIGADVPDALGKHDDGSGHGASAIRGGRSEPTVVFGSWEGLGDAEFSPANAFSPESRSRGAISESSWWGVEPQVGRVVDGLANRVDQLKGIGNGQVPGVVRKAWHILSK